MQQQVLTRPMLSFQRNDYVQIVPEVSLCNKDQVNTDRKAWLGTIKSDEIYGAYMIEFEDQMCPPRMTLPDKLELVYWLKEYVDGWQIVPAYATAPNTLLRNGAVKCISIQVLEHRARSPPGFHGTAYDMFARDKKVQTEPDTEPGSDFAQNSRSRKTTSPVSEVEEATKADLAPPLSIKTLLENDDIKRTQRLIRHELMGKFKPELVRMVVGGKLNGLGIRNPPEVDYRKEWLVLPVNSVVMVRVDITNEEGETMAQTVLKARVLQRHERSVAVNGLGIVYELEVSKISGDEVDIQTFTPMFIGRRRIKYWLCVYYDLDGCKVIATSSLVTYPEFESDMALGSEQLLRLAEYPVGEIKLATEAGEIVPFAGDKEDDDQKALLKKSEEAKMAVAEQTTEALDTSHPLDYDGVQAATATVPHTVHKPSQSARRLTTPAPGIPRSAALADSIAAATASGTKTVQPHSRTSSLTSVGDEDDDLTSVDMSIFNKVSALPDFSSIHSSANGKETTPTTRRRRVARGGPVQQMSAAERRVKMQSLV